MSILPRRAVIALIASLTLVTATGTAWAHHGWSEYDARKRTTLTGTIRELHFVNPHATIVLETPDKTWSVMLDSPARLQNRGVTVEGLPHKTKDGEFRAERLMLGGKTIELR
jgi:DNA topoisomerase VI subunit B